MARPSKYDEKYCEQLITHMSKGLSFESFAGDIGVGRRTIYDWVDKFEAFSHAKKIGESASLRFWESLGIALASGKRKGNASTYIFTMKNRFKWTDRHELEVEQSKPFTFNYTPKKTTDDE